MVDFFVGEQMVDDVDVFCQMFVVYGFGWLFVVCYMFVYGFFVVQCCLELFGEYFFECGEGLCDYDGVIVLFRGVDYFD